VDIFCQRYLELLHGKFAGLNLTNITEPSAFKQKQYQDSILPLSQSQEFVKRVWEYGKVLDIGFGGGFPLLPLSNELKEISFLGIEARNKKVLAVRQIASELVLPRVSVFHLRLEDLLIDIPIACTLKAVGTIKNYTARMNFNHINFSVFFYKGPDYEAELAEISGSKTWKICTVNELRLEGAEKRVLIEMRPQNVPRGTFKNLVKLSDLPYK
jgi:16S rRNA (guanine527-N7)-methyltransferase